MTHTAILTVEGIQGQSHLDAIVDLVNTTAYVAGIQVTA